DACGEVQFHERVHRLRRRLNDIQETLVGPDFELLSRLLVNMRTAQDRIFVDVRRQRNGPANFCARAFRRVYNFTCRSIENAMVIRFQADADILVFHYSGHSRRETWQPRRAARKLSSYAGDDAGADGAAAFADRETQAF